MVDKCRKFGVKNILISCLVFTTRVSLEVLEKIREKLSTFCSGYGLIYVMFCSFWYHLYNLKNIKNLDEGVLPLVVTLLHGCFSGFLNCINDTKSHNASQY